MVCINEYYSQTNQHSDIASNIYIYREYTFLMVIFCFHNSHGDIEWDDFAHMINYNDFIIG